MKIYKTIFISSVILLLAMGFICGLSGSKSDDSKKDNPDKQETTQDKKEQKKDDYKITHKEIKEKNTKMNYEINITYPQIEAAHTGAQGKFNSYVFTMMNAQADSFRTEMKTWDQKSKYGSEFEITDTVVFMNDNTISVLFSFYISFAGTAHPSHDAMSINYDLKNNKVLGISDLFTGKYLDIISQSSIKQIIQRKKEYSGNDEIDTTDLYMGAGPDAKNFQVFNITSDTLFVSFPEYQVGAYVEGEFYSAIPYSIFKEVINPTGPIKELVK